MFRTLSLAIGILAAPTADAAQTYICRIVENGKTGWIPEILFVGREDGADTAVISDPLILYFNDSAPVRARVAADNPRRTTFVWAIRANVRGMPYIGRLQYTATYLKADRKMLISAKPIGYSVQFSGEGTCNVERR